MITLLLLFNCNSTPVEIDPELDLCMVVSSEQTAPDAAVLVLLPNTLDIKETALAPLEGSARWTSLRLELMVDEESPTYLLMREATGPTASCPTVIRTPVLGSLSLDDGVEVFVVSGWAETTSASGEPHLESFRLGGYAHYHPFREEVQEALVELSSLTLAELRPEIDLSEVGQISAGIYLRGDPEGGQLGVKASFDESLLGYDYEGPLLSGPWTPG